MEGLRPLRKERIRAASFGAASASSSNFGNVLDGRPSLGCRSVVIRSPV